jgi:hypothetical protein
MGCQPSAVQHPEFIVMNPHQALIGSWVCGGTHITSTTLGQPVEQLKLSFKNMNTTIFIYLIFLKGKGSSMV